MVEFSFENIMNSIDQIIEIEKMMTEKKIAKLVMENDFIVGTPIVREQIKDILPSDANIVVSTLIDPRVIIMAKKFVLHPNTPLTGKDINVSATKGGEQNG